MRRCLGWLFHRGLWLALLGGCLSLQAPAQEWRGLWVDAFHDGFKTSQQVSQLVANVRGANCNAIVVEVRKRGDAYYKSQYEPLATDIASDFDPLQDLLNKAHDTNAGPRIEVHAWMVTFPVWGDQVNPPAATNHVFNLHPDWLTQDSASNKWAGSFYVLDPAHPGVQEHLYQVAMDLVTNYAVDGLNFDYIRYPENNASNGNNPWGYNPASIARFNRLFSRNGLPGATDPLWIQFRRDQVTALVRKVYLNAVAARPGVKISADTITWYPGVTTDQEWLSSAGAYNRVLQDWRAWMEEGILDLNLPMNYFRQNTSYASDYAKWNQFTKDHHYNRHAAIGPGLYLNGLSNGLYQMRLTREVTPSGNRADGVCGYSYAVPASNTIPALQATFLSALTQPSLYDPVTPSLFAAPAPVPVMPWKTAPSQGHLKGLVLDAASNSGCDGATVTLSGPANKTLLADATGFYGAVDLPPGNYSLVASMAGHRSLATNFTIVAGVVTTRDLPLAVVLPSNNVTVTPGARAAIISWTTPMPATTQVEYFSGTNRSSLTSFDPQLLLQHAVFLAGLEPDTSYCAQAISLSGPDEYRSSNACFTTAGTMILDNVGAVFGGSWSTGTMSTDKYLGDYRFASTVSGAATSVATFTPAITTPGNYDVFVWYPQGSNRSANAPHTVVFNGGSVTVNVNQQINGGGWRLLAFGKPFAAGVSGCVQIANNTGESGKVVMADAVRFVYSDGQEPPAGLTVPLWWSQYYFGSNVNALVDHDQDGYPTWAEFCLGTSPTNAASHLDFRLENQNGLHAVFAPFLAGRVYHLESLASLSSSNLTGSWQLPSNQTIQLLPTGQAAIPISPGNNPQSLYRLKADWVR